MAAPRFPFHPSPTWALLATSCAHTSFDMTVAGQRVRLAQFSGCEEGINTPKLCLLCFRPLRRPATEGSARCRSTSLATEGGGFASIGTEAIRPGISLGLRNSSEFALDGHATQSADKKRFLAARVWPKRRRRHRPEESHLPREANTLTSQQVDRFNAHNIPVRQSMNFTRTAKCSTSITKCFG